MPILVGFKGVRAHVHPALVTCIQGKSCGEGMDLYKYKATQAAVIFVH